MPYIDIAWRVNTIAERDLIEVSVPEVMQYVHVRTGNELYQAIAAGQGASIWGGNEVPVIAAPHTVGGASHIADTLANFNTKISDATLDDITGERTAAIHGLGDSARHSSATLAQLNALISDATLTTNLLGLTDTPGTYAGAGTYIVRVNAGATAVEFVDPSTLASSIDHSGLMGLADDGHTQYALLAGRGSNQTLNGAANSGGTLTLSSTADPSKNKIYLGSSQVSAYDEANQRLGIGRNDPEVQLHVYGGNSGGAALASANVTIEDNNQAIIELLSAAESTGVIYWSEDTSSQVAQIRASSDEMSFGVGGDWMTYDATTPRLEIYANTLVQQGTSSGAVATVVANDMVLDNNGDTGISILSSTTDSGYIVFGDSGSSVIGGIEYNHANNSLRFTTNGSECLYLDSSFQLNLTPAADVYWAFQSNALINHQRFSNTATAAPRHSFRRGRGTLASPTAVQSGDILGRLECEGQYDSSNMSSGSHGEIRFLTTENWNSVSRGTEMVFYTTPNGSTTAAARVTIGQDGIVSYGVAQTAAYTPTNVVTDRSYDANSTSVAELADVLGTLIADLQANNSLG